MIALTAKVCGLEGGVVVILVSVRPSSHNSGGSSSSASVARFVEGRLCIESGDGVNVQAEDVVEEGVVVAEVGVNTIARFGVTGGVAGTVGSGGSIRTLGC